MTVPAAVLRKPHALRPGDRIAIVAPASPFDADALARGVAEIESLGFEPVLDERLHARDGFVAGPPALRAAHLTEMWLRPDVRGLMCARGGYGSVQMLSYLSPDLLASQPKAFVGYSDITTLLTFFTQRCGMVAFHGPTVIGRLSEGPEAYDPHTLLAAMGQPLALGDIGDFDGETLIPGEAAGPLCGGTLTQVLGSLGTPHAFTMPPGGILLVDEVNERPYRLDRMIVQLWQAGLLQQASAVILGDLPGCDEPGGEPRARDTVLAALAGFEGPVVWRLPSGHTPRAAITLPLGVRTRLVARESPRVIIEEAAVV